MSRLFMRITNVFFGTIAITICLIVVYNVFLFCTFRKTGLSLTSSSIEQSKKENVFISEMIASKKTEEHFPVGKAWVEKSSHLKPERKYGIFYEREIDEHCHLVFTMKQDSTNNFHLDSMFNWRMENNVIGEHLRYVGRHGNMYRLSMQDCNISDSIVLHLSLGDTRAYEPLLIDVGSIIFKPKKQ